MNNYILELKDNEGNIEEVKLRLRSADCIEIENKTGKKMLDLIQDYSMKTIIMLLKYMRRSEMPQFSEKEACDLYDKLIDNGYNIETVLSGIVYEGLVASGFLTKEDLEKMKETTEQIQERIQQEITKSPQK